MRDSLDSAPVPPGSLTSPGSPAEILAYLAALTTWTEQLHVAIDHVDSIAQVAATPATYTADITLAMALFASIDARHRELVVAWDSGRVQAAELESIASLLWGRLPDPLGKPSAFTLNEACSLVGALHDRLVANLSRDAIAGSGRGGAIAPLRDAIQRCRRQMEALGFDPAPLDALAAQLDAATSGSDPDVAGTIDRVDAAVSLLERDLIKEASRRAGAALFAANVAQEAAKLRVMRDEVRELARRCADKIVDAPHLAVADVDVLHAPGDISNPPTAAQIAELERYERELVRVRATLEMARTAYAGPLDERDELRGLLGAYRHRAGSHGLSEDLELSSTYRRAHGLLWSAPCDLAEARALVTDYTTGVRAAITGTDQAHLDTRSASGSDVPPEEQL